MARAARVAGRSAIRERGYAHVATMFPISVPPAAKKRRNGSLTPKTQPRTPPVQTLEQGPRTSAERELYNCRRKIRHIDCLSALLHARRLQDDDIQIYSCVVYDGLHVGHAPSPITRRRRHIVKQLEALQLKIQELDRDCELLVRREFELRSESGKCIQSVSTRML